MERQAVHAQGIRSAVCRGARCDSRTERPHAARFAGDGGINLRRAGLSYAQIGDIVGMSAKMVEHYCRNADMRSNSRAALTHLERAMARPAGVKAYNHVAMTRTNPEKARNGAN
jgi:hypothetical protein